MRQLSPAPPRHGVRPGSLAMGRAWGFTLVELMVAAAVLSLLTSISYVSFFPFLQERRLRQASVELQTQLLKARMLAQKSQTSCRVTQTDSATVSFGADSSLSGNACTTTNLQTLSLSGITGAISLAVVAGTSTTLTFNANGTLAGGTDAETILSANGTPVQACVKTTAPAGLILVGTRPSAGNTCNYVMD